MRNEPPQFRYCINLSGQGAPAFERPRIRDIGVKIGILPTGPWNAITDVPDVRVGHTTIVRGDSVRTGITAVLPHSGNLFQEKVPGAVFVGNGFGKLIGSTQVNELGEIETPILLTSTLSAARVADALVEYILRQSGNEDVQSVNPVVGETNDGMLNDIRGRHIGKDDVTSAIENAKAGAVQEGSTGAGTGTVAFGFKGGIGTSSRRLPVALGEYTVGVLVQSNYGGVLSIAGAPVGQELGRYYLKDELERKDDARSSRAEPSIPNSITNQSTGVRNVADGSVMVVVATDAPVDHRNLGRMALRAIMGVARTGSSGAQCSGDYSIAFSNAPGLRIRSSDNRVAEHLTKNQQLSSLYTPQEIRVLSNRAMSPLFLAVIEATEEAIYNSLFRATPVESRLRCIDALPIRETIDILRKYGVLEPDNDHG